MKYIFTTLLISFLTLSTAKAETWSCAHKGTLEDPEALVVIVYKRVGDHFVHAKFPDKPHLKLKIQYESRRVLALSNHDIREDQEISVWHTIMIDKRNGKAKASFTSLWANSRSLNIAYPKTCTKSD